LAYYLITDFQAGLDTRRLTESARAGSLRELQNGFVNSGGEVQKLQGFVVEQTLTAALNEAAAAGGWVGPARTSDGGLVFAGPGIQPSSFPNFVGTTPVYWSQLSNSLVNPEGLSSADVFGNKVYLVVQYDIHSGYKHFYGQPGQQLTEVLDGDANALQDPFVRTIASKVWRASQGAVLGYSEVNDPTLTEATDGGGIIDVTTAEGAIGPLKGLGVYRNRLAVFGTSGVQIWEVDPDPGPTSTFLTEVIGGLNVVAGKTITTYDSGDVLFLTPNGVRSLRAQNVTNNAAVDDIGTPIDDLVRQAILTGRADPQGLAALVGEDQSVFSTPPAKNMLGLIEPITGQYWLAIGGTIFILSRFRGSNVLAWSMARLPNAYLGGTDGHIKGAAAATDRMVICTEDNTAYLYGGELGLDYDQTPLVVTTPFLDFDDPAAEKSFFALDLVSRGRWKVEAAFDPQQPDSFEFIGTVEGTTTRMQQISMTGRSTHISLRLTSTDNDTIATLSKAAVHFKPGRKA
jgi:hypothetical protein